jgi:hypothetical protein
VKTGSRPNRKPKRLAVAHGEIVLDARLVSNLLTDSEILQIERRVNSKRGMGLKSRIITDEIAAKLEQRMTLTSIARAVNEDMGTPSKPKLYES